MNKVFNKEGAMRYYSTNGKSPVVSLKDAVLNGMPEDRGLYMPESFEEKELSYWAALRGKTFNEVALATAKILLPGFDHDLISKMIDGYDFAPEVVLIKDRFSVLELFHGPTLAFKDFGARFMAKLMSYFNRGNDEPLTILVATSGDTGSAVAHGFYKIPGIRVVILYPDGKISPSQEQQIATLDHNISSLAVAGTFDDCQALVKRAFVDPELSTQLRLSSANSINIARLIPQTFYYVYAWTQLPVDQKLVVCVPSGNFGNLTAGLMAKKIGVPIDHFIAATNSNKIVPAYLKSGLYAPQKSLATISNAMDVGDPSNFPRILDLHDGDYNRVKSEIEGDWYSDDETRKAILRVYQEEGYLLDPHGAIGYLALEKYLAANSDYQGIFLETAHPGKFSDVIEPVISEVVELPERLKKALTLPKKPHKIENNFETIKAYLLDQFALK